MSTSYQHSALNDSFRKFLESLGISKGTIKNYVSDTNYFINWLSDLDDKENIKDSLTPQISELYKSHLLQSGTPIVTIKRRLSSLRRLGHFLKQSSVVDFDFTSNLSSEISDHGPSHDHSLVNQFKNYLQVTGVSKNTLRNYVSDVAQFLEVENQNIQNNSSKEELIKDYLKYLDRAKPTTIKRKSISLNRFLGWYTKDEAKSQYANKRALPIKKFVIGSVIASYLILAVKFIGDLGVSQELPIASYVNPPQVSATDSDLNKSTQEGVLAFKRIGNLKIDQKALDSVPSENLPTDVYYLYIQNNSNSSKSDSTDYVLTSEKSQKVLLGQNSLESGKSFIPAGNSEAIIYSEKINSSTFVYLTLTSDSAAGNIFVKEKQNGFFKVGLSQQNDKEVDFDWLAIK